jgi:multidrug efflux system membrane fusion protein
LQIEARIPPGGTPGAPQLAPPSPGSTPPADTDGGSMPAPAGRAVAGTTEGGTVSFIDNSVDPTTGTIRMKGTFANADHALWPGLFVQVTLVLRTDPKAIVVPAAAVQASQAGPFIYVVKADRTVEVRNVTVERQQGEEIVIEQGVAPGEEVVTDGQLRLTAGARVTTGTRGEGAGETSGGARRGGTRGNQP